MVRHYIYVVEFSNGVVKVGKTVSGVDGRFRAHQRDAERFDLTISRRWFTEVTHSRACEVQLINAAHELGGEITRGLEYFRRVGYAAVVAAGERIALEESAILNTR